MKANDINRSAKSKARWKSLGRETVGTASYVLRFGSYGGGDINMWYKSATREAKHD